MSKPFYTSLTEAEKIIYNKAVQRLQNMRDQREKSDKEKNNLTYSQLYNLNREADLAFSDMSSLIAPDDDTGTQRKYEMTSGATRSKDTSLVSHLCSFNFEPDIVAFDQDNEMVSDLGETVEDLIIRSLEIEQWDNRQIDAQREFITQGNVFVREVTTKNPITIHDNGMWTTANKISEYKKDPNKITKYDYKLERQLILGKNVFLSSIRERNIQKQSEVAVWEEMSYDKAESIYGGWDRWSFVRETKGKGCESKIESIIKQDKTEDWGSESFWNLQKPEEGCGILHVYNSIKKTYMVYINGIWMLPLEYSIYEISPSGLIPIGKGDAEVIPGYAYAKWIPANTLVDTKLYDMVANSMAQKMSQSARPTLSNNTGHNIQTNLLYSGRILNGLRAWGLTPTLPDEARSITPSETAYIQFIKQIIADKSIDDAFSGQPQGVDTATEFLERKKNTILKLFSLLEGWKDLEEQLARLRIASIFTKWTEAEEVPFFKDVVKIVEWVEEVVGKEKIASTKNEYRKETIQTKIRSSGQAGIRQVRFFWKDSENVPDPEDKDTLYDLANEEKKLGKKYGKPTRVSYINSEALSRLFEWYWVIDIRQAREDDSHLDLMVYVDAKTRIAQLFPDSLNKDYTLQKIARIQSEDVDKAYNKEQPISIPPGWGAPEWAPPQASGAPAPETMSNPLSSVMWAQQVNDLAWV